LNDEVGKDFRAEEQPGTPRRSGAARYAVKILVVDPVLGSRFSLVRGASQPGFVVDACATPEEAFRHLARTAYALVLADESLGSVTGIDFLEAVETRHPETARALVSGEARFEWKRAAIERAGLIFLLPKPWTVDALRRTLRELFGSTQPYAGWNRVEALRTPRRPADGPSLDVTAGHEVLLRGLLAGLNSCATENEVFELLRSELAGAFGAMRWLWIDEAGGVATRLSGDWALEEAIDLERLPESDLVCLAKARRSVRVARLEVAPATEAEPREAEACLGLGLRVGDRRIWTGLVWMKGGDGAACLKVLRELIGGLQLAVQRIRDARARSLAARELARRVSEDLRTPVGALAHAVDLLRGEAERAGLPAEWVDRISSESERVSRAVEHLEGELLTSSPHADLQAG